MRDTHVHIGQFYETYYEPLEVLDAVMEYGMEEVWFSSTTSANEEIRYGEIEKEIEAVLKKYSSRVSIPFLWYKSEYKKQGVTVEKACDGLPYGGIKLHPRANAWNVEDTETAAILEELFGYAQEHTLPVLVHTGYDTIDNANLFSPFFGNYPAVSFILAHCRPLDQTLSLLQKHPNVYCDTAFLEEQNFRKLIEAGFSKKIHTGSDFPVTHFYGKSSSLPISTQYANDVKQMLKYFKIISEAKQ